MLDTFMKGLIYLNKLSKGLTPDLKNMNKLNELKIREDGQYSLSKEILDKIYPELNSSIANKHNTIMKEKKIVNNKPSQFGPILGVDFHNIRM